MATVPMWRWQNDSGNGNPGGFGFFFKLLTAPSNNTTLMDLDGSGSGYFRVFITSGMIVKLDMSFSGVTETITANGSALSTGVWYWVFVYGAVQGGYYEGQHKIAIYDRNGTLLYNTAGSTHNMGGPNSGTTAYRVGLGASLTSGYDTFPNTANYKMTKAIVITQQVGIMSPPTSDPGGTATWLARQTVGSAATLNGTPGTYDATAGGGGLTIYLEGPYP